MMQTAFSTVLLAATLLFRGADGRTKNLPTSIYEVGAIGIDGEPFNFADHQGKVRKLHARARPACSPRPAEAPRA